MWVNEYNISKWIQFNITNHIENMLKIYTWEKTRRKSQNCEY